MKFTHVAELTAWALQAKALWLFLDYDGTLADFAPTPDHLEPNRKVINLFGQLVRKPNLRLSVISGRRLADIQTLLPVPGVYLGGTYGIELLIPNGESLQRVKYDEIRPTLETIKPQWEKIIATRKGFFLEDKGWTLALHARFAEAAEAEIVIEEARRVLLKSMSDHFQILGGHKFLEIAPRLANKRETVFYLIKHYPLSGAQLLYMGDDDKDEQAFGAIHTLGGIAVKIVQPSQASQPTEADFLLDSPKAATAWLEGLI